MAELFCTTRVDVCRREFTQHDHANSWFRHRVGAAGGKCCGARQQLAGPARRAIRPVARRTTAYRNELLTGPMTVMILRLRRRNDAKIAMAQQRSQLPLADAAIS